jgi:sugar phosphate isomerase/epimerase
VEIAPEASQDERVQQLPYLCSGTLGGLAPNKKIRCAATAGFAKVSMYTNEIADLGVGVVAEAGIGIAELDGGVRDLLTAIDRSIIEAAASVGAELVTCVQVGGPDFESAEIRSAGAILRSLASQAADVGVKVQLEPFAWSKVASFPLAVQILSEADHPNCGLLLDTWHFVHGPDQGKGLADIPLELIFAVQLSDPNPSASSLSLRDASMTCRAQPGPRGPSSVMVSDLVARGYTSPFGAEIYCAENDSRDPQLVADETFAATSSLLK